MIWGIRMPDDTTDVTAAGNPTTDPDQERQFRQRLLEQAFELWINPELERRRASGTLKEPFQFLMAQQIQRPDGTTIVRLNDEVRGIASLIASRDMETGEGILLSDLDGLQNFDLEEDELDCGHWTVFRTGKRWFTSFNFLTHRAKCIDLLSKASQFLAAAIHAKKENHLSVVVDTLFSACELISKSQLVSSRVIKMDTKSHGQVASQINAWRKLGNVESAFVDLFNRMNLLRPRYRYDVTFSESMPASEDDLALVAQMIDSETKRLRSKI
jgi:hypothetical protein